MYHYRWPWRKMYRQHRTVLMSYAFQFIHSCSYHETIASAWQPNGSNDVILYLILMAIASVDVPVTLRGSTDMDQKWYRSSKMKLHLEIQYSLLERKIIIRLRNLPGLRDLVRQKLVMGVKTNMGLQWIMAAKNPQIMYVTGRVKLGMKGQTEGREMQGKCTVLWMLRSESQREKGESQMTPGFWTGRQAAVYQIEAGYFWLRSM